MKRFADEFEFFLKTALVDPKDVTALQLADVRLTFYSGAIAMLSLLGDGEDETALREEVREYWNKCVDEVVQ